MAAGTWFQARPQNQQIVMSTGVIDPLNKSGGIMQKYNYKEKKNGTLNNRFHASQKRGFPLLLPIHPKIDINPASQHQRFNTYSNSAPRSSSQSAPAPHYTRFFFG